MNFFYKSIKIPIFFLIVKMMLEIKQKYITLVLCKKIKKTIIKRTYLFFFMQIYLIHSINYLYLKSKNNKIILNQLITFY